MKFTILSILVGVICFPFFVFLKDLGYDFVSAIICVPLGLLAGNILFRCYEDMQTNPWYDEDLI